MITIRNRKDLINIGEWKGNTLSFEFRTFENNVTLISSSDGEVSLLLHGRHLTLVLNGEKMELMPQVRYIRKWLFYCQFFQFCFIISF